MLCLLAACSKNKSGSSDRELPVVTLSSPLANQAYTTGQAVNITGTISDNEKIAQVHVHISNLDNGNLLVDIHRYPGTASYSLNEQFTVPGTGTYRIQVIATDNSANENRATVTISGN